MDIKIIPALLCLGLFLIFAMPLSVGIVNLGNCAGMGVCGILTLIFIFWGRFASFIEKSWEKPLGKVLISLVGAFTVVSVVLAVFISVFMVKASDDPPRDENTTIVVLGCKVKNGAPSRMLARRLEAAYDYLSEHESVCAVVSGGKGDDEAISEAQCMKEWLVNKGIAPERIYMEDRSVNTEENLRFSKEIISANGLPEKITLVTDSYHQLRAEMIAEKQDIKAYNISGYTSWYLVPTYWVREWFGVVYYKIFG
ncbi:MAG: YdcF family protein [Ruminococcus sp.]|uniref:YdcF family protein n=1 Tax=Ruminococcus sp. TaxID=41978 RepID=UPI0025D41F5E|nr:YdcF family protein [Ruminococcus sp.]MCR4796097.1 YdcF family protein [Ruminococcus sp.]